jgi:hypothetical protein
LGTCAICSRWDAASGGATPPLRCDAGSAGLRSDPPRGCAAQRGFASERHGLTARKIEQILRDADISKSVARAIVAHGFKAAVGQDTDAEVEAVAALIEKLPSAAAAVLKGNPQNE